MSRITRRQLLLRGAVGGLALSSLAINARGYALSEKTRQALAESPLVYISPLKSNGEESNCHGEVWYYVDRGDVLVGSAASTWKVKAVNSGLNQARVWIADYGPEWRALKRYRAAPSFVAQVMIEDSQAAFERLMQGHAQRYPQEWVEWEQRFRSEYNNGSRKILRYSPVGD